MSIRDKSIILILVTVFSSYLCYNYLWTPVNTQISKLHLDEKELISKIGDQTPLNEKIKELSKKNSDLLKNIDSFRNEKSGKSLNKEDFLVYLGDCCNKNNAELIKFNDLGCAQDGENVWKLKLDFELRGELSNLVKICNDIDNIGIKYSVGGMSIRQNEDLEYLTRYFDSISKLEWYKVVPRLPSIESDNVPVSNEDVPSIPTVEPNEEMPTPSPNVPTSQPTPEVETDVPVTPKEEVPSAPQTITEKLDRLLELQNSTFGEYSYKFLTNSTGEKMRMNITIQFTFYSDPQDFGNSIFGGEV